MLLRTVQVSRWEGSTMEKYLKDSACTIGTKND